MSRAFHAPGLLASEHSEYDCQCGGDHSQETVAIRPVLNPVISEWRKSYLEGFGRAALDMAWRGHWDPIMLVGGAYSAFVMGYRAAVKEAGQRR